jgi:hypothetical protein
MKSRHSLKCLQSFSEEESIARTTLYVNWSGNLGGRQSQTVRMCVMCNALRTVRLYAAPTDPRYSRSTISA